MIPEFDHVAVPKSERAERQDTITEVQFEKLVKALIAFLGFEDPGYSVESKQLSRRERPVEFLNVRDNTKTGRRTVPAVCGDVIEKIKEDLCVDQSPDAPLFQDLDGRPIRLLTLRLYFNEVCARMEMWADLLTSMSCVTSGFRDDCKKACP